MKVLTILGTRPEIIRLSRVIPRLDQVCEKHILVHTGQNSDPKLSDIFFEELGIRKCDHYLGATGSFAEQVASIFPQIERILRSERPDRVLVLGDTNSSLAAIVAARLRIPVYHMEAGNRCHDPRSPEEVNRRLIDHASSVLLPYTERARENLLAEGIEGRRIFVTGNPINEVISHYAPEFGRSSFLSQRDLIDRRYFLVTLHREENVDSPARLIQFLRAFTMLRLKYKMPVVVSVHPRTRKRLSGIDAYGLELDSQIKFLDPFGFFDFITLERSAFCVLTDSGTVQEESCILGTPSVILRDTTERPETMEAGASALSGADPDTILRLVAQVTDQWPALGQWSSPEGYLRTNVSDTVVRIVTSHRSEA